MKTNDINNVHVKAYKEMFSNKEAFHEFLRDLVDKEAVLKMTSNLSTILDREFEARDKKGEERGEQKARRIVITQLNKKFPNLPQIFNDKIQKAKIEVVEKIAEDIFIINTIDELEKYL